MKNKITIGVIFTDDQIKFLEKDSEKNGRLLSTHIRYIIQQYIDKEANKDAESNNS